MMTNMFVRVTKGEVRKRIPMLAAGMAIVAVSASPSLAQQAGASQPAVAEQTSPFDPAAVVAEVRRIIAERYVLPEKRPVLDAALAEGLASGRYNVREGNALAERINADLERVGRDRHLNFRFDPQQAVLRAAAAQPNGGQQAALALERQVREANHGVRELRLLPGNIRYLAYDSFRWQGTESAAALETAMRFLSAGDAVIIDLTRNTGGSPAAVQYIISHFLPAGQPLVSFSMSSATSPERNSVLAEVPAGRMIGKPLYILTSRSTASAAEEFVGHVSGFKIGELIGANTSGGGYRNTVLPIANNFLLSVSIARSVLASTGKAWEGVGHVPNVPVPVFDALPVAQARALRRLAAAQNGVERTRLEAMAEAMSARVEARAPALPLGAYAGTYGDRIVTAKGEELYLQGLNRARDLLIPLGGNSFFVESNPVMRINFAPTGGQVTQFTLEQVGSPVVQRFTRNQ